MLTPAPRIGKFAGPAPPATVKPRHRKREKVTKATPKPAPVLMPRPGLINQ